VFSLRFHDFLTSGGCIFWIYSPKVVYLISWSNQASQRSSSRTRHGTSRTTTGASSRVVGNSCSLPLGFWL
jgi:hypothetical protein